jgi:ADP-ribose pyrophosphatase YjhB (NUDIX family)
MKQKPRKALFNEKNVTPGGTCLSSFVLVRSGGAVLVGRMRKHEIWVDRFFVGEKFAPDYLASGKYLLPARHLAWYESPLAAAESVVREQVRLKVPRSRIRLMGVQSHVRGDVDSSERPPHWDICFVYEAKVPAKTASRLKTPPWFKDFQFVPLSALSVADFTRGHGDILEEAGLLSRR